MGDIKPQLSQVWSTGTNWDKPAPSLDLLKYAVVAESHGDTQAGLTLPLWQSAGAAGPSPAIPKHRAGRVQRERVGLAADSAPSRCGGYGSAGDPCASGVQASLWSPSLRLCMSPRAFNALGKSSCDPGTPVIWGWPFGPCFVEVVLHPTAVVAASHPCEVGAALTLFVSMKCCCGSSFWHRERGVLRGSGIGTHVQCHRC